MNREFKKTVFIVSHDMEHVLNYCDDVLVMKNGSVYKYCSVKEFFANTSILEELKINPPAVIAMREALNKKGFKLSDDITNIEDLAKAIAKEVKAHG